MGEKLFLLIRQIGIFMICAQMLLHFKASESYGKYIRLLMSMMVLIQLAAPLAGLLRQKSGEEWSLSLTRYEELVSERMTEINQTCQEAEAMLEAWTLDELKENLGEQLSAGSLSAGQLSGGQMPNEQLPIELLSVEINQIEVSGYEE